MIRLAGQTLIIPRGDTGSFSLPLTNQYDIAVFSIYDPSGRKTVFEKTISAFNDKLTITLISQDTAHIAPKKYLWDIKLYRAPQYDVDGTLVGGQVVDSYFAAYRLPICDIKEVAQCYDN